MGESHHLPPLEAAVQPPPNPPWSMVVIRNHHHDGNSKPPLIFPPINHENLHISTDPQPKSDRTPLIHADDQQLSFSDSDSDSSSSSTFSASVSSPSPPSPVFLDPTARPTDDAAAWLNSWTGMLYSKASSLVRFFCISFASSRGVFLAIRSAAFPAVVLAFLYFRRRKLRRERLIGIIRERDEKINQLLDQISRMNQVLLTLHKVPIHKVA